MVTSLPAEGRVITFYSFKGGVGRTMAMANMAFLAALNGQRVLVMDWDLEAPGLPYYFRCLHDAAEARRLRESPGVLDLLWDWVDSTKHVTNDQEFNRLLARFSSGEPFASRVHSLIPDGYDLNGGQLHFMGAGGKTVPACDQSYEDALAAFSWPDFFQAQVGGVMLDTLRRWAKAKYDLVLLDSRTGLADVAGICTMQLPDVVALCFVLNRQNIDGIARVANAIRSKRADEVQVRAVPMRVAQRDSSEASDAQARALAELTRRGGFPKDVAREELRSLAIRASEGVPYYETLAPFVTDEPVTDPLSQNYAQVASRLFGFNIAARPLEDSWVAEARERLQPKLATLDYIAKLKTAEPERVFEELSRLLERALEYALDENDLDQEYVRSLVEVVEVIESYDVQRATGLYSLVMDLLRTLASSDPGQWQPYFATTLGQYLRGFGLVLDTEDAIPLFEEYDSLLQLDVTVEGTLRRIVAKTTLAQIYFRSNNHDLARQTAEDVLHAAHQLKHAHSSLSADQIDTLTVVEIDARLLLAEESGEVGAGSNSERHYVAALDLAKSCSLDTASLDLRRAVSLLYYRLTVLEPVEQDPYFTAECAVRAIVWTPRGLSKVTRFALLGRRLLESNHTREHVVQFVRAAFSLDAPRPAIAASALGRTLRGVAAFVDVVLNVLEELGDDVTQGEREALQTLAPITEAVLSNPRRRLGTAERETTAEAIDLQLSEAFGRVGIPFNPDHAAPQPGSVSRPGNRKDDQ